MMLTNLSVRWNLSSGRPILVDQQLAFLLRAVSYNQDKVSVELHLHSFTYDYYNIMHHKKDGPC